MINTGERIEDSKRFDQLSRKYFTLPLYGVYYERVNQGGGSSGDPCYIPEKSERA